MSKNLVEVVGAIDHGRIVTKPGKPPVAVIQTKKDQYGDAAFAFGVVKLELDYEPITSWAQAYQAALRLLDEDQPQ